MKIFIVHGYSAGTQDHWFPWLADKLTAQGHDVSIVELPSPQAPVRAEWDATIAAAIGSVDATTAIITHSLGGITVLRHLDSLTGDWELAGLVMVSGFLGELEAIPDLDDYLAEGLDVSALPAHIGRLSMIYSDNDEFVPPAMSRTLAGQLGADEYEVAGAGHFLGADGHTELPVAFDEVQKIHLS